MKILLLSLAFAGVGAYAQAVPAIPDTEYTDERLGKLTVGLVNMYCLLPNITCLTESGSSSQQLAHHPCTTSARIDTLPGFSYFFDLAARLAIERVNSDSSMLPGIHVEYRRFSNCGNTWSKELESSYSGDSAGYAGSEMVREILEDPAGVVGTIGFEFSRTVTVAAEVLSHYKVTVIFPVVRVVLTCVAQIPHCSSSAGSPRFSNKNKYPYFWRMISSADVCDHVHLLLVHWGVKRVAMIRERNDELGFNVGADILQTFRAKGIQISAKIDISGNLDDEDAVYAKNLIVNTQTHYIFVSGQAEFTASVLYRLGKLNVTGSEYVFIGFTAPLPYGNPFEEGYVMVSTLPDSTNLRYKEFNKLILSRTQVNTWSNGSLLSPDFDFIMSYGLDTAYDCTMAMLKGIEKLMKSNPEFNASMVSKRMLNEQMNYSHFQDLDYTGVLGEPRRLDSKGDVKMRYQFLRYINASVMIIGTSDPDAKRFEASKEYIDALKGGFSALPPDGSPKSSLFATDRHSTLGQIIIVLTGLGVVFGVLSLVFIYLFRKNKIVRSSSIPELLALTGVGFSVVISTIICKNLMVAKLFGGFHIQFPKGVTRIHRMINCAIILMGIIVVITIQRLRGPPSISEKYSVSGTYFICVENTKRGPWFLPYILTLYYGLLFSGLFLALFKSQRIRWDCSNEAGAITLIILVATISYAVQSMLSVHVDEMTDFRKCICVWIQTSVVLFSVIGSKMWTVFKYEMQRSKVRSHISQLMTRLADREEQAIKSLVRLGEDRSKSFGKSGGVIFRKSASSLAGKKKLAISSYIDRKEVLMFTVLSKTVSKCIYKYQREKSSKSMWCTGECQVFSVCDRMWFLFQSEETTNPFRILDNIEIQDCNDGYLVIQQESLHTIWLEFESAAKVSLFVKELQNALADLKTVQSRYVRQDSVNMIRSVDM
ncbi:hypothetical protein HDU77_010996 [Chytriomyces hyalinus]|nr:hypothetical protein HDU77_010996 [Chytriomyces hyalinus]